CGGRSTGFGASFAMPRVASIVAAARPEFPLYEIANAVVNPRETTMTAARPIFRQKPTRAPADVSRMADLSPNPPPRITRGRKSPGGTLRAPPLADADAAAATARPPAPNTAVAFRTPTDSACCGAGAVYSCAASVT